MARPKGSKDGPHVNRKGQGAGRAKPLIARICKTCGAEFVGQIGRFYCGNACALWPFMQASDGCWTWTGYKRPDGYGEAYFYENNVRTRVLAHRAVCAAFKGDPSGLYVCHACDNPQCVNPAHLFLGTAADNSADRNAKGRQARGERNGPAKLTERQVLAIRRVPVGAHTKELAETYGVDRNTIRAIRRRKTWSHVE